MTVFSHCLATFNEPLHVLRMVGNSNEFELKHLNELPNEIPVLY